MQLDQYHVESRKDFVHLCVLQVLAVFEQIECNLGITEYFIRYLRRRATLSDIDLARLQNISVQIETFWSGDVIIEAGIRASRSCMMLKGLSARSHKLVGRGDDRVITALPVPGDYIDLHGCILPGLDHSIVAIGPVEVEFVAHDELAETVRHFPV